MSATRLEVCRRTVQRDIEFLRDRLSAPLIFDPESNGYAYGDPAFRLPFLTLSEGNGTRGTSSGGSARFPSLTERG